MQVDVDPRLLTDTAARLRAAVSVAREVAEHRSRLGGLFAACGSDRLESGFSSGFRGRTDVRVRLR